MAQTNVQAFSGDVEVAGGLSITGSVTSTTGIDKVKLATDGTNANRSIIFSTGTTGAQPLKTDAGITYNPSNNKLTVSGGLSTSVTPGSYLTGSAYNGSTARTFSVDATTTSTASKVVARDASKNIFVNKLYVGDSTSLGITKYIGQYGSVSTLGAGSSSYAGYAIRDDWVFMSNGASLAGIYDDTNDDWAVKFNALGSVQLYHSGNLKLATTSTGVTVTGTFSGNLNGNARGLSGPIFYAFNNGNSNGFDYSIASGARTTFISTYLTDTTINVGSRYYTSGGNKGRFVASAAGYYAFQGSAGLSASTGAAILMFRKNGTTYMPAIDGNNFSVSGYQVLTTRHQINAVQVILYLAANDYIELVVFTSSSGTITGSYKNNSCTFSGYRLY
jgi:hypothetical protein